SPRSRLVFFVIEPPALVPSPLSLHDALPIWGRDGHDGPGRAHSGQDLGTPRLAAHGGRSPSAGPAARAGFGHHGQRQHELAADRRIAGAALGTVQTHPGGLVRRGPGTPDLQRYRPRELLLTLSPVVVAAGLIVVGGDLG